MLSKYPGWGEAVERAREGLVRTVAQKTVTYDLAQQMEGSTEVKCSQFAERIIKNM